MIKYLIMDVDGTLTNGKIYMGDSGEMMKAFDIKDGYGIAQILPKYGIKPVVITARRSKIVENRCKELSIDEVHQGVSEKLERLNAIVDDLSECAYIGDDVIDLKCMEPIKEAGGIVGCPADSVEAVKERADYICVKAGGDGAVREFIEWLIKKN